MRVTWIGHACHLIEIDGLRILTDPWLTDPIFEGNCEHAPPRVIGPDDLPTLDAIALTHGHLDHFNAPTLAVLPDKSIPVVLPPIRFTEVDANLRRLGYYNLYPLEDWQAFALGSARIIATPALGVLDECAFWIEGRTGRFWNGADAPQPVEVIAAIARRLGAPDLAALSHNSFDQPALLGLPSHKPADHGPEGAAQTAKLLGAHAAFGAASSMCWRGPEGASLTRRVIRRDACHLQTSLAATAPEVEALDLHPGDAWSREGGIERAVLRGTPAPHVSHDYVHAFLDTGERHCPPGRPETEATFRRDLPALLDARITASQYVGQRVAIEVVGDDPGTFTLDFNQPGSAPETGDVNAPFALRVHDTDWKDLFERRIPWQVLLAGGNLAVTRSHPGPPPDGLHFCYALQAIFP